MDGAPCHRLSSPLPSSGDRGYPLLGGRRMEHVQRVGSDRRPYSPVSRGRAEIGPMDGPLCLTRRTQAHPRRPLRGFRRSFRGDLDRTVLGSHSSSLAPHLLLPAVPLFFRTRLLPTTFLLVLHYPPVSRPYAGLPESFSSRFPFKSLLKRGGFR